MTFGRRHAAAIEALTDAEATDLATDLASSTRPTLARNVLAGATRTHPAHLAAHGGATREALAALVGSDPGTARTLIACRALEHNVLKALGLARA